MSTPPPFPQAPGAGNDFSAVPPPPYGSDPYGNQYGNQYGGLPVPGTNGMAVAALVLGILSVPLFFLSWVDSIVAILAIVFAVIGVRRATRGAGRRGMAIAGLVLGTVGLIASVIFLVVVVLFAKDLTQRCQDQLGHPPTSAELRQCVQNDI